MTRSHTGNKDGGDGLCSLAVYTGACTTWKGSFEQIEGEKKGGMNVPQKSLENTNP